MLTVNNSELPAFDRRDNDRGKFRLVEIFRNLIDVDCSASTDVASTTSLSVSIHSRNGAGPGTNTDCGETKRFVLRGLNIVTSAIEESPPTPADRRNAPFQRDRETYTQLRNLCFALPRQFLDPKRKINHK